MGYIVEGNKRTETSAMGGATEAVESVWTARCDTKSEAEEVRAMLEAEGLTRVTISPESDLPDERPID